MVSKISVPTLLQNSKCLWILMDFSPPLSFWSSFPSFLGLRYSGSSSIWTRCLGMYIDCHLIEIKKYRKLTDNSFISSWVVNVIVPGWYVILNMSGNLTHVCFAALIQFLVIFGTFFGKVLSFLKVIYWLLEIIFLLFHHFF